MMRSRIFCLAASVVLGLLLVPSSYAQDANRDVVMTVPATDDFDLTGDGSHSAWDAAAWVALSPRWDVHHNYTTRVKLLYSGTGLYLLFDGTDAHLTATLRGDNLKLWTEDVYEAFFWTDEAHPFYFEYEISPLGYELPLMVPNVDSTFFGWIPWQYEGERRARKATTILGGDKTPGATIDGWRAEVFLPYDLLRPLANVPPTPGTHWRANFYRIDYDGGTATHWSWTPTEVNFHDYRRFGTLVFE